MNSVEIKPGVYWVGGIDWDLRNSHGYLTQRGTTYDAYVIIDEKVVLGDVESFMDGLGWDRPTESIDLNYVPDEEELDLVKQAGVELAGHIKG